jgi:hypothetical protein
MPKILLMDDCFWDNIKKRLRSLNKPDIWLIRNAGLGKTAIVNGQQKRTSPSVDIAYRCAKTLRTSIEELADSKGGALYLREYVSKAGWGFSPPERVADVIEALMELSDDELVPIRGAIRAILDSKDGAEEREAKPKRPPQKAG